MKIENGPAAVMEDEQAKPLNISLGRRLSRTIPESEHLLTSLTAPMVHNIEELMRETSKIRKTPWALVFFFVYFLCLFMVAPLWAQVDSNTQDLGIMRLVQKAPLLSAQGTPTIINSEAWQGQ